MTQDKIVQISITAKGPIGSGKSRAIAAMLKAITSDPEFEIKDSRFYKWPNHEEEQTIELVMK